jgi:hypothetical protein
LLLAAGTLLALASAASAEVTLTFYSHHFGTYGLGVTFPHAYVRLSGTTKADATAGGNILNRLTTLIQRIALPS